MRSNRTGFGLFSFALLGAAASACSGYPGELFSADDQKSTTVQGASSSPVLADTLFLADTLSDDAFKAAAGCSACAIVNKRQLNLPLTKVVAVSAKLFDGEQPHVVTLLADGVTADEQSLLRNEREAHIATYGKLTPDLYERLRSQSQAPAITVAIWQNVMDSRPNRNNPDEVKASEDAIAAQLTNSSTRILNKLATVSATVRAPGTTSPLIIATLPSSAIEDVAALPEVAAIGTADPPVPTGPVWYDTIGGDTAHLYGTGTNVHICNAEFKQPDDYSLLNVSGIRVPSGPTLDHTRWTSGIMKNINSPVDSLAPDALMYIDNDDGTNWYYIVSNWCSASPQRASYINRSFISDSGEPGPSSVVDWYWDWLAMRYPFPLVISSAGNQGQIAGADTVMNRNYNGLIVGGSDTMQTSSVADDIVWGGYSTPAASWRNPATTWNDYELPNLMAPASYPVTAVGFSGSATSAAAPQVTGAAAIVGKVGTGLLSWPEGVRAILMATAVPQPVDAPQFDTLSLRGDRATGVGILNAGAAAWLAQDQNKWTNAAKPSGYYTFTCITYANFVNYEWTTKFTTGPIWGRLRAVIAWDGTSGGCGPDGSGCTGSVLDADLDLEVLDTTTGSSNWSSTFDSSYEAVDFPVVSGHSYEISVWSGVFHNTYGTCIGVAWYNY